MHDNVVCIFIYALGKRDYEHEFEFILRPFCQLDADLFTTFIYYDCVDAIRSNCQLCKKCTSNKKRYCFWTTLVFVLFRCVWFVVWYMNVYIYICVYGYNLIILKILFPLNHYRKWLLCYTQTNGLEIFDASNIKLLLAQDQ